MTFIEISFHAETICFTEARTHFLSCEPPDHGRHVNNLVFLISDTMATRGQLGGRIRCGYDQCGDESGTEYESNLANPMGI